MYLRGSKWSYTRRRKRASPWRIMVLVALVSGALYVNQVVVPATPPLFIPTPTATRSPESFITEAEGLLTQGKLAPAIASYREAVQANPENASNYVTLAKLLIYTGKYEEAVIMAEDALLLNPNNSMAHAVRGYGYAFQGDYLLAEGALDQALSLDKSNAIAYAYLAETLVLKDQEGTGDPTTLDKAIEASRQAEQFGPSLMETHRARGMVLEQTGNQEEAVGQFEAAVALNGNIADLHLALGRNYRFLEQYNKAIEEFNRATALNPLDPQPLLYISRTYAAIGEYPKAIQYAEQAVKAQPDDPFLYGNLGTFFYRYHNYVEAIPAMRMAISGGTAEDGTVVEGIPLDTTARIMEYYYIYGLALARQGDCGEALKISQLLLQTIPDDEDDMNQTARYNAQEMINICQNLADSPPPQATSTETEESGEAVDSEPTPAEATPAP